MIGFDSFFMLEFFYIEILITNESDFEYIRKSFDVLNNDMIEEKFQSRNRKRILIELKIKYFMFIHFGKSVV